MFTDLTWILLTLFITCYEFYFNDSLSENIRDLAYLRAAYSFPLSNDVNHTAHLVTNGLLSYTHKESITIFSSQYNDQPASHSVTNLAKPEKTQTFLSIHPQTDIYIYYPFGPQKIARYTITPTIFYPSRNPSSWVLYGSDDNSSFIPLDRQNNIVFNHTTYNPLLFNISNSMRSYRYYKFSFTKNHGNMEGPFGGMIEISQIELSSNSSSPLSEKESFSKRLNNSKSFSSDNYWEIQQSGSYLYVDLGALSSIESLKLVWGINSFPPTYLIQIANGTRRSTATTLSVPPAMNNHIHPKENDWVTVYNFSSDTESTHIINLDEPIYGTFVRVYLTDCTTTCKLYQMQVFGRNSLGIRITPRATFDEQKQIMPLNDGNWELMRDSESVYSGEILSSEQYNLQQQTHHLSNTKEDSSSERWVPATVPGTVLTSYLNIGAIPDPNYGDQQLLISDSFFTASFWYRTSFTVPISQKCRTEDGKRRRIWLNFDAINWKADVYLNGYHVTPRIEGAFIRTKYDVTDLITFDSGSSDSSNQNYLVVFIQKNDHPGTVDTKTVTKAGHNGGILGADNPTIHASVGLDWVMTIRGRDTGIYNDVYLSFTDDLILEDPWIETQVPAAKINKTTRSLSANGNTIIAGQKEADAQLTLHCIVKNMAPSPIECKLEAKLTPSDIVFRRTIQIPGNDTVKIDLKQSLHNARLWWPNRYGDPFLYDCTVTVEEIHPPTESSPILSSLPTFSSINMFKVGIREIEYNNTGCLGIVVNGIPIFCSGGNWGMDESMLRCRTAEDFDIRVRLHKEAHFNMIRNWIGMTADEEFYNACDSCS